MVQVIYNGNMLTVTAEKYGKTSKGTEYIKEGKIIINNEISGSFRLEDPADIETKSIMKNREAYERIRDEYFKKYPSGIMQSWPVCDIKELNDEREKAYDDLIVAEIAFLTSLEKEGREMSKLYERCDLISEEVMLNGKRYPYSFVSQYTSEPKNKKDNIIFSFDLKKPIVIDLNQK